MLGQMCSSRALCFLIKVSPNSLVSVYIHMETDSLWECHHSLTGVKRSPT